jgi:hypothetical protein
MIAERAVASRHEDAFLFVPSARWTGCRISVLRVSLPPPRLVHMIGRERAVRVSAPHSAQASLPIRVYLRYGTHHRMGPTGGRLDSDSDELDFPYAEAIVFHRDVFKTSRLIITRGRSADVGSVYSSTLCTSFKNCCSNCCCRPNMVYVGHSWAWRLISLFLLT